MVRSIKGDVCQNSDHPSNKVNPFFGSWETFSLRSLYLLSPDWATTFFPPSVKMRVNLFKLCLLEDTGEQITDT